MSEGPYPLWGKVDVFVRSDQLDAARELLLGDAVDAAFDESAAAKDLFDPAAPAGATHTTVGHGRRRGVARVFVIAVVLVLLVVGVIAAFH